MKKRKNLSTKQLKENNSRTMDTALLNTGPFNCLLPRSSSQSFCKNERASWAAKLFEIHTE